jgi:dsDNA-specific endonuclease/ATPase MutS2
VFEGFRELSARAGVMSAPGLGAFVHPHVADASNATIAQVKPPTEVDGDEPIAVLAIEDSIDLHGFRPADIRSVVVDYLEEAAQRGFEEVRLIHGRGKGVQRASIHALLAGHPLVEGYRDAPATRGGWGATLVRLRTPAPVH